jgi:hypothetical protein
MWIIESGELEAELFSVTINSLPSTISVASSRITSTVSPLRVVVPVHPLGCVVPRHNRYHTSTRAGRRRFEISQEFCWYFNLVSSYSGKFFRLRPIYISKGVQIKLKSKLAFHRSPSLLFLPTSTSEIQVPRLLNRQLTHLNNSLSLSLISSSSPAFLDHPSLTSFSH